MVNAILRKLRQVAGDPVLRRWLVLRALRLTPGEPGFTPHLPPCLGPDWGGLELEKSAAVFSALPEGPPKGRITLRLPGQAVDVEPGGEAEVVARAYADPETQLGLHRFAWVPLMTNGDDPRWVGVLWNAWMARFGTPDSSWAWHPYTAAERAINLLTFVNRHGLPASAIGSLAAHAPVMAARLEWFGGHHTSNHLFNNARGLYLLGLALGLPQATETGAKILLAELGRIFRLSGVLREGSSHYHLLLTRSLASIWLAARAHSRPETEAFEKALRRAVAALPHFDLPGRFPLVGDISPDCPPEHLFCLMPGGDRRSGWMDRLTPEDRTRLAVVLDSVAPSDSLVEDGWLRAEFGDWTGLWHADPDGWSHMPGHGHQDCGGFELHYEREPVFLDLGRGSYAVAGEADEMVSARAHNGLSVDGADPYPANKPYYAPAFRARVTGAPPRLTRTEQGVDLSFSGFQRFEVTRNWRFEGRKLVLTDHVAGKSSHLLIRRLHTACHVERMEEGLRLTAPGGRRFTITAPGAVITVSETTLWAAYGEGQPASRIELTVTAPLPWSGSITVEAA